MISGALFSDCGKYRFKLWRVWDTSKPRLLCIGYNPSKANASFNDLTTKRVINFGKNWGFGGVYLMNCFPRIATNPNALQHFDKIEENDRHLKEVSVSCEEVIFAWGNFKKVVEFKRDIVMMHLFPKAKVIAYNKNGSPKHPLYTKSDAKPVLYTSTKILLK